MVTLPFDNRAQAAAELANALGGLRGTRPLVLAIPRGAVPMARLVADALGGDLDILLVKKIAAWLDADPAYVRAEAARQLAATQARPWRRPSPRCGGTLEQAASLAGDFFARFLPAAAPCRAASA